MGSLACNKRFLNCDYNNLVRDQAFGAHVAGSASFGTPRDFILRKNSDHSDKIAFELGSGDVLIMKVIAPFWDYINRLHHACELMWTSCSQQRWLFKAAIIDIILI